MRSQIIQCFGKNSAASPMGLKFCFFSVKTLQYCDLLRL